MAEEEGVEGVVGGFGGGVVVLGHWGMNVDVARTIISCSPSHIAAISITARPKRSVGNEYIFLIAIRDEGIKASTQSKSYRPKVEHQSLQDA